jgi:glycosyltransferase involved in cell wall biosynthesis
VVSAIAQSRSPDEVLVIDNSPAGDIERSLGPMEGSVRVHRENRKGAAYARNTGLRVASSAFCAFLDSDDEWSPDFLAEMASAIIRSPEADLFVGAAIVHTDEREKRVPAPHFGRDPFRRLLLRNPITTSATAADRLKAIAAGGFLEGLSAGCEDWALWLRMSRSSAIVAVDSAYVIRYESRDSVRGRGEPAFYEDIKRVLESVLDDDSSGRLRRIARAGISMHRGTHLLRRGERSEARRLFRVSVRLCPSSLWAWLWVGISHTPVSIEALVRAHARRGHVR